MTINKNKWIYYVICRFTLSRWLEAQHAALVSQEKINNSL